MKHAIPHDLDQETLRTVVDKALRSYAADLSQYDPTVDWKNEQQVLIGFAVKGLSLKGRLDLKPTTVDVDLDVPFVLRPFKKKAIAVIEREFNTWLTRAKAGEI